MTNPYSVLGVPPSASDDEIKKAYRALCRKYHPDVNMDNPKAAEEKFKQVGEAYRLIMDERSGKQTSSFSDNASQTSDQRLRSASVYIQRGYFREAINVLNSITDRSALWYYLSAVANARLGNNILAREYAKTAASMDPGNPTYQNLNAALNGEGTIFREYQTRGTTYGRTVNIDNVDTCVKCCAANLFLNLCCGNHWFCCC